MARYEVSFTESKVGYMTVEAEHEREAQAKAEEYYFAGKKMNWIDIEFSVGDIEFLAPEIIHPRIIK